MNSEVIQSEDHKATAVRKRARRVDSVDILAFTIPCLQFIQIKLIGVTNGSDLLLMAVFLYLLFRKRIRISTPVGRRFIILGSLWLVSQCVTDIIRHSAFTDYARGWSNIGMTLVNFAVICTLLYGRPSRLVLYGWGLVAGNVLTYFISPSKYTAGSPWKFGISYPVTLAVLLLASRKKCRSHWSIAMVALIGIINIYLDSRNMGGACLGAALYLLVTRYLQRKGTAIFKLNTRVAVTIAASIILGSVTILWAYQYAAKTGMLGEDARDKYESQSSGEYGLLIGGRVEMLGYLPAIYDSPILGHGSWAKDPTYLIAERQALALMGYPNPEDISVDELEEGLIPTHSYLFGAWVDAGILGALFWGWVLVLAARALMRFYPSTVVLLPILAYVAFSLFWDILFSPYGMTTRIIAPYYVVMLMTCMSMAPQGTAQAATRKVKRRIGTTLTSRRLRESART